MRAAVQCLYTRCCWPLSHLTQSTKHAFNKLTLNILEKKQTNMYTASQCSSNTQNPRDCVDFKPSDEPHHSSSELNVNRLWAKLKQPRFPVLTLHWRCDWGTGTPQSTSPLEGHTHTAAIKKDRKTSDVIVTATSIKKKKHLERIL